jgi:uncharacterized protein
MGRMSVARRHLMTMIIGMALILPVAAPTGASETVPLPDPVTFTNSMELGDIKQATLWLDNGLSPDFLGSRIGSGLMIGAWEGNLELMRLFISRGADINQANSNGETPIVLAAWRGKKDAVKWLIDRGARINAPKRQWSALHYAVFGGHRELADYLIDEGADINAQSTNGSSVLMMAVYEGHEDLARKLIEKGADRTVRNDWGDAALSWAMRFNRLTIARMVSNPEVFNIAVSQPKESWGEARRSVRTSKELENMLATRAVLLERGMSTEGLDKRIASERARIIRAELNQPALPSRSSTLEISASRNQPADQKTRLITDDKAKAGTFKVPPATFHGKPRMPPKPPAKGTVKNY